jgi:hypothetical protein
VARVPLQLPAAVQVVASVDAQVKVAEEPGFTVIGATVRVRVGAVGSVGGWLTVTVTVWLAAPLLPEQLSVYDVFADSGPVDWLPDEAFDPVHPPDARQSEVLADDQVSVAVEPFCTV